MEEKMTLLKDLELQLEKMTAKSKDARNELEEKNVIIQDLMNECSALRLQVSRIHIHDTCTHTTLLTAQITLSTLYTPSWYSQPVICPVTESAMQLCVVIFIFLCYFVYSKLIFVDVEYCVSIYITLHVLTGTQAY